MGKQRKKKVVGATASKHKGRQLPARADDYLYGVLEEIAAEEDRKVAQVVLVLLKEALRARGRWSPPAKP